MASFPHPLKSLKYWDLSFLLSDAIQNNIRITFVVPFFILTVVTLIFVTGIFSVSERSHQTSDILLDLTCLNFFVDSWWLTWLDLLSEISFTCILPWSILQYFAKDNKGVKTNEIYCSFYNLWMIKQNLKKFPLIFMVFNKKKIWK